MKVLRLVGSDALPEISDQGLFIGLTLIARNGEKAEIRGKTGDSLMEAITDSGQGDLAAVCGGSCSCGTCHVYVQERYMPKLQAIADYERQLLDCSGYRQSNSRLSCQIQLTEELDNMTVAVAPEG